MEEDSETEDKGSREKAITVACTFYFTGGIMAICIVCSILAFHETEEDKRLCSANANPSRTIEITNFFTGVFVMLSILGASSLLAMNWSPICKYLVKPYFREYYRKVWNGIYMGLMGIVCGLSSIIGLVMHGNSTQECKDTGAGKELLAWCIISMLYTPVMCCLSPLIFLDAWKTKKNQQNSVDVEQLIPSAS
eukprot:545208_1